MRLRARAVGIGLLSVSAKTEILGFSKKLLITRPFREDECVSTFAGSAACAVQGLYRRGFKWASCRSAIYALACNGFTLGPGDPVARGCGACAAGRGKLAPHQAFLEDWVIQDSDITLYKLRDPL